MTDQIYLWLLPVLALGSFLLGGYLLVTDRQAKAAGAESNTIKFLGVEIQSSTSGTTLVALAVVVVAVVIAMGVGNASNDGDDDRGDDEETSETVTDPTTTGHTGSTGTGQTSNPNPGGLERDDLISVNDLEDATEDHDFTNWRDVDAENRPVLDCLAQQMPTLTGFLQKPVKDNFEGQGPFTYPADAMTSAARFETEAAAADVYQQVRGWLETCPGGVSGSTPLDANQAGPLERDGDLAWRTFWQDATDQCASSCVWVNSQGVALVDDTILLVSVRWFAEQDPTTITGPMPDLLPVVVDQLG